MLGEGGKQLGSVRAVVVIDMNWEEVLHVRAEVFCSLCSAESRRGRKSSELDLAVFSQPLIPPGSHLHPPN